MIFLLSIVLIAAIGWDFYLVMVCTDLRASNAELRQALAAANTNHLSADQSTAMHLVNDCEAAALAVVDLVTAHPPLSEAMVPDIVHLATIRSLQAKHRQSNIHLEKRQ
jgi:hypothetical protein